MADTRLSHVPNVEARAAIASLIVSIVLLGAKFVAYWITGSAAVFSDALESIVNVVAAAFAAYSLFLAHQPADELHPYGHGKIEFLSAGFEGGLIIAAAILIIVRAAQELIHGVELQRVNLGIGIMAIAGVINGGMGLYLISAGRRRKSLTLEADGKHLLTDAVTSVVVVIALAIVMFSGWVYADPIAAICVAIYITWIGIGLLRQSAAGLMDEQDTADDKLLREILDSHLPTGGKTPTICSYHKLRHRHTGRYHWVDFHLMFPAHMTIEAAHHDASAIEYEIEQALGEGNATAHLEPCEDANCASCHRNSPQSTRSTQS